MKTTGAKHKAFINFLGGASLTENDFNRVQYNTASIPLLKLEVESACIFGRFRLFGKDDVNDLLTEYVDRGYIRLIQNGATPRYFVGTEKLALAYYGKKTSAYQGLKIKRG
jgi:hypothetical protein